MCIEMKASIKMNTRILQRYGVAVILRLRTTKAVAAGDNVFVYVQGVGHDRGFCRMCPPWSQHFHS